MKKKRPLVWLSAAFDYHEPAPEVAERWRIYPFNLTKSPPLFLKRFSEARVGVLDFSQYSNHAGLYLGEWIEAFQLPFWVGILPAPPFPDNSLISAIAKYCADYNTHPAHPATMNTILGHLWGMAELQQSNGITYGEGYQAAAMEGVSLAIRQARTLLRRFAHTQEPVLIHGESGTGKEAAAHFIHANSSRRHRPLITVNCAALPISLTHSELFGYEKGAFTHALTARMGRLEAADQGTLLLAGIDEFKPDQQSAILRFLQEGRIERIGANLPIIIDTRIIATSTRPLGSLVAEGHFRGDVYYRLGGLEVQLPPLRERPEDIPALSDHIVRNFHTPMGPRKLSEKALQCMAMYSWPGNLRELQNQLRQAVLLSEHPLIEPEDLGLVDMPLVSSDRSNFTLKQFRARAEQQAISCSLALTQHNVSAAARLLKISRVSLYRLMEKHAPFPQQTERNWPDRGRH